jgi:hypothetical protein
MLVKVPENGDEAGGGGNGQPREGGAEGGNIVAAETGGNTKQPATEFEGAWNLDGEILQQPSKNSLYFR